MNKNILIALFCFAGVLMMSELSYSQSGEISGTVKDAVTGEALPGANVFLQGTAIGAATNLEGKYLIRKIPPGKYTLRVSFIGYKQKEVEIQVHPKETEKLDITLEYDVVEGQAVVITAQAEGQVAAINQQLRSNTIKNVVSAERIMELPDVNAAESVGRLPGISIKRSGGEGSTVVIRGLAPTYNAITINGSKVPATSDDRSVNLSMISPEMLEGIEVTKALTADQDADAIGGTVNFKIANAPTGGFHSSFRFQGGYNNLRDEYGQYSGSFNLSNRFLNDKLGIIVTGNMSRNRRDSDTFSAGYNITREKREGEEMAPMACSYVNLVYIDQIRERAGFSLILDYKLPNGKIMMNTFTSRMDNDGNTYTNQYIEESNWHMLYFNGQESQTDILSSSLSGEHNFSFGDLDWSLSRNSSLARTPFSNEISFKETGAFNQTLIPNENFGPQVLVNAAYNNYDEMFLYSGKFRTRSGIEKDYTSQLNFKMPYTITNKIAGYIKFGGKYLNKEKERDTNYSKRRLDTNNSEYEEYHTGYGTPGFDFEKSVQGYPLVSNYIDNGFDPGNFLDGAYEFGPGLNGDELNYLLSAFLQDSLYEFISETNLDDYETLEKISAGYLMTEINFGRFLMLLPGVRYEYTENDMTGRKGWINDDTYEPDLDSVDSYVADTTATSTYSNWFPMIHARVRPAKWCDLRLAYTETISRPRLDYKLPKKKVSGSDNIVSFGRPDLAPQISKNYDLFLSFYGNDLGLLTCGGFYKEISDLIYKRSGHKILNAEKEGFAPELQGFLLDQPENNPYEARVKGWEVEWQTRLHWLPGLLDGFVLNANYTHIWSETRYPRSFVVQEKIKEFPYVLTTVIDTFRVADMLDQSDNIANISLGYDKGALSARLSMLYQGKTLSGVGERPEWDRFTTDLVRWDLSVKYRLTSQLSFFFNWNNISNEPDEVYQEQSRFITSQVFYGWTSDFGIGYTF